MRKNKNLVKGLINGLVILILLVFTVVFTMRLNVKADEANEVYLITTTPGENSSSEIRINYHSSNMGSYIEYTKEDDIEFLEKIVVKPNEEKWSTEEYEVCKNETFYKKPRYVCSAEINNLEASTTYLYRVVLGEVTSRTFTFTTSGLTNTFDFIAITDTQNHYNTNSHPLIEKLLNESNAKLLVSSGDMVDVGGNEEEWRFILKDSIFSQITYASSPGDHEYWASDTGSPYPMFKQPEGYNHIFNNPKNGTDERKNSTYYFFYNNVMFVALDFGDSNTSSADFINNEVNWFKKVTKENEGKYQYLVVLVHKSIYGGSKEDSGVVAKLNPLWYPVFSEANVDLVLSGHDHMFSRTYQLYQNQITDNPLLGTYYLDMGSSGNKRREGNENLYTDGLHEKAINMKEEGYTVGSIISVSEDKMVVKVIELGGKVIDTFIIQAKRKPLDIDVSGFSKEKFDESLRFDTNGENKVLKYDTESLKYIKQIEVRNSRNSLCGSKNINIKTRSEDFILDKYSKTTDTYTIIVTLNDNTVVKFTKEMLIEKDFGNISDLKYDLNCGEFKLSWNNNLINDVIVNIKLFINDELIETLNPKATSVVINNSYLFTDNLIKLVLVNKQGDEKFSISTSFEHVEKPKITLEKSKVKVGEEVKVRVEFVDMSFVNVKYDENLVSVYVDRITGPTFTPSLKDEFTLIITALHEGECVISIGVEGTSEEDSVTIAIEKVIEEETPNENTDDPTGDPTDYPTDDPVDTPTEEPDVIKPKGGCKSGASMIYYLLSLGIALKLLKRRFEF